MDKGVTTAKLLQIETGDKLVLPEEIAKEIGAKQALVILVFRDKNLKIFPIEGNEVYHLKLEISNLTRNFLQYLTNAFKQSGLKEVLFTTGLCVESDKCYYESYFNRPSEDFDIELLKKLLSKIEGVKEVEIKKL